MPVCGWKDSRAESRGAKSISCITVKGFPNALVIRPEDIQIASYSTGDNVWPAKVEQVVFLGAIYDCRLALEDVTLRAQFPRSAVLEVGQQIYIHVDERRCVPIEE